MPVQRTPSRLYLTCNFFGPLSPAPHNVLGSALVFAKQSVREFLTRAPTVFATQLSGAKPVLPLRLWAGTVGTGQGCGGLSCGQHWHAWEVGVAAAGGRPRGAVRHGLPVWTVKREHQARPGPASPTSLTAQKNLASLADPAKLERNGSHLTLSRRAGFLDIELKQTRYPYAYGGHYDSDRFDDLARLSQILGMRSTSAWRT